MSQIGRGSLNFKLAIREMNFRVPNKLTGLNKRTGGKIWQN